MATGARPLLLVAAGDASARWRAAFAAALPEVEVLGPELPADPAAVEYVAAWRPPDGLFARLPRLRAVFALGAGVDGLLARSDLLPSVALLKLADAGMAAQMLEYALIGVLAWQRRLGEYALLQQRRQWQPLPPRQRHEVRVSVLGLGRIGSEVASGLARLGYGTSGWSRSVHAIEGVHCCSGDAALADLLPRTDVLVNMLPSTAQTRGLLGRRQLALLPRGANVVHASRGDQLDAAALLELLDSGHLGAAWLDVFATEPLPPDSPLWTHPRVHITPHVAAVTLVEPAVAQVADNLRRLLRGQSPANQVDRARGY